jgi:hypothetical protein
MRRARPQRPPIEAASRHPFDYLGCVCAGAGAGVVVVLGAVVVVVGAGVVAGAVAVFEEVGWPGMKNQMPITTTTTSAAIPINANCWFFDMVRSPPSPQNRLLMWEVVPSAPLDAAQKVGKRRQPLTPFRGLCHFVAPAIRCRKHRR